MQKVTLSHLQREILGLSLKESKMNVDQLLEGEIIIVKTEELEVAQKFIEEARKIKVICRLENYEKE